MAKDPKAPVTNEYLDSAIDHVVNRISKIMDEKLAPLKSGHQNLKRQINDLKVDTPTQKEFTKLKDKVEHHHPTN